MSKIYDEDAKNEANDRLADAAMKSIQDLGATKDAFQIETLVRRDGDTIVLKPADYEIPLSRCQNAEQLLGWIAHLSEKIWVTPDTLRQLILVAKDCGVPVDFNM